MKWLPVGRDRALLVWIVLVPMALAIIYYSIFAVERYVSSSQVVVRQASSEGAAQQVPGLALLMGGAGMTSREETVYLSQFIDSDNMLSVLEESLKWRTHYAEQRRDPLYWLDVAVSRERLLDFYRRLVTVHYDEITGLLSVKVEAFSPDFALQIQQIIIEESEKLVNEISHRMAREQMRFAEQELGIARKNYEDQRDRMIRFQSENNLLDAEASAESRSQILADLESTITKERAQLTALLAQLDPGSPQVRQQRNRLAALDKQLAVEKGRLVSAAPDGRLNVVAAQYRNLMLDVGIAEEAYKLSVSALENARIEASKKIRTLVTIVKPTKAEEAVYPNRLYNLFTIFIVLLLVFGIVRFILASIEDHRD